MRLTEVLNPGFVGGITEQNIWERRPNQLQRQRNFWCSIKDNVALRHPMEHIGTLPIGNGINPGSDHGGPSQGVLFKDTTGVRYSLIASQKELRAVNLDTGESHPVLPKGGGGPTDFSYLISKRPEIFAITDSEKLGSLDVTVGGPGVGKNGAATAKTIAAPGNLIGPWGGLIPLSGFSANTIPGFWFAWTTAGTGGNVLGNGWNTIEKRVKLGGAGDRVGLAIYDDTSSAFLAAVTFQWSGAVLGTTPLYVAGSPSDPNIVASVVNEGFGWFTVTLRYRATTAVGHSFSFGPYVTNPAGNSQHIFCGLRYEREYDIQSYYKTALESVRMLPINDYVLVLNRDKVPAMTADVTCVKTFGQKIYFTGANNPAEGSKFDITINGVTKTFTFKAAPGADADPNYDVDRQTSSLLLSVANGFANKINKAFGTTIAHAVGVDAAAPNSFAAVSIVYAAGTTVTLTPTGVTQTELDELVNEAHVNFRGPSYDDSYWLRMQVATYDVHAAWAVTSLQIDSGQNPKGQTKCVNGDPFAIASDTVCAKSNGGLGVRVTSGATGQRAQGVSADDVAGVAFQQLQLAFTATADSQKDGWVIQGIASGVPLIRDRITVDRDHGLLRFLGQSGNDPALTAFDSTNAESMLVIHGKVRRIEDLPKFATHNMRVRVEGDPSTQVDDAFYRFIADAGSGLGSGNWEESADYGVVSKIDPTTVPHQVVRRQDDGAGTKTTIPWKIYFEYDYINYSQRLVGDLSLAPNPSFVGHPIKAMVFFRGRIWYITGNTAVGTASNPSPTTGFNFFLTSVRETRDDDRIDAPISHIKPAELHAAVPFADRLYLFSDSAVFLLSGPDILSRDTVSIKAIQELVSDAIAIPVPTEHSILIPYRNGAFVGLHEMLLSSEATTQKTIDLTQHVTSSFRGQPKQLAVSLMHEFVALAYGTSNECAMFKYEDEVDRRLQAAWHTYATGGGGTTTPILRVVGFLDSYFYAIHQRVNGWYVERTNLGNGLYEADGSWLCSLDRRVTEISPGVQVSFAAGNTTLTLPYTPDVGEVLIIRNRMTGALLGTITGAGIAIFTVTGVNLTNQPFYVGYPFVGEIELSKPVRRENEEGRLVPRTQVGDLHLSYERTNDFDVTITTRTGGVKPTMGFSAPSKDAAYHDTNTALFLDSGIHVAGVQSAAEQAIIVLRGGNGLPCRFTKAEYTGKREDRALRG